MELSYNELLAQFRARSGLSPSRNNCSLDVLAGVDVDRLLEQHIRDWYAKIIENGVPELLDPENIASLLTAESIGDGTAIVHLPPECRRIFTIKLKGWQREAQVLDHKKYPRLMYQLAATSSIQRTTHPYALLVGRSVILYTAPQGGVTPEITYASGVVLRPDTDVFRFSPMALSTIEPLKFKF